MNWAIKIFSKTLMTKIYHISWGVTTKGVTTKAFTVIKSVLKHIYFVMFGFKLLILISGLG